MFTYAKIVLYPPMTDCCSVTYHFWTIDNTSYGITEYILGKQHGFWQLWSGDQVVKKFSGVSFRFMP